MLDTHDQPVPTPVWHLYALAQTLTGGVSKLLEWDANIPDYPDFRAELDKASLVMAGHFPGMKINAASGTSISTPVHFQLEELSTS